MFPPQEQGNYSLNILKRSNILSCLHFFSLVQQFSDWNELFINTKFWSNLIKNNSLLDN